MSQKPADLQESENSSPQIDPSWFRQVLGQYPTGVCVVTARSDAGEPIAMVVGSFSSVSLNPPLVAFFPDKKSSSWAKLRSCEYFCVNVLSAEQETVCRTLASKNEDKFAGVSHTATSRGNPVIAGCVAWIDCRRHDVVDAGDHEMVLGRVLELDQAGGALPLLFFRGGYGRFTPASLAMGEQQGITLGQLRSIDRVRSEMERLTERIGGFCIATLRLEDELVIAASSGKPRQGGAVTLVGQRLPFAAPTGAVFAAWLPERDRPVWPAVDGRDSNQLQTVRQRGYSVGLRNEAQSALSKRLHSAAENEGHHADIGDLLSQLRYDPAELTVELSQDVRLISAPVFDRVGEVEVALTLYDFPKPDSNGGIQRYIEEVVSTAAIATHKLGGPGNGS